MTTNPRVPWMALSVRLLVVLATCLPTAARAACPESICDCLGEAKTFSVVASGVPSIKGGRYRFTGGYPGYPTGTFIEGDLCAPAALLSGFVDSQTGLFNLIALAGPGRIAAQFYAHDPYHEGYSYPGVLVDEQVITGGGRVVGEVEVGVGIDTTGTHPRLGSCQQAINDMQSASATLAALAPTQDLGRVSVRGETFEINAGPGVNVIAATEIALRVKRVPPYEYPEPAILQINLDPSTQAVIVNTPRLRVRGECEIVVDYSGSEGKVILNVPGHGSTVAISLQGTVTVPILAPDRRVLVGGKLVTGVFEWGDYSVVNLFARRVSLRTAFVQESFFCR